MKVVIDKMADLVRGNEAEFCPLAQGANGGFASDGKDAAEAQAVDVRQRAGWRRVALLAEAGRCVAVSGGVVLSVGITSSCCASTRRLVRDDGPGQARCAVRRCRSVAGAQAAAGRAASSACAGGGSGDGMSCTMAGFGSVAAAWAGRSLGRMAKNASASCGLLTSR